MKEELVTSPKVNLGNRNRINILTKELNLKKYSNVIGFLLTVYDLIFKGRNFQNTTEMIVFVQELLKDEELLARENIELKAKLKNIQRIIEE